MTTSKSKSPVRFTTRGTVCRGCDHEHRTLAGAVACLGQQQDRLVSERGPTACTDAVIVRTDGVPLTYFERREAWHRWLVRA